MPHRLEFNVSVLHIGNPSCFHSVQPCMLHCSIHLQDCFEQAAFKVMLVTQMCSWSSRTTWPIGKEGTDCVSSWTAVQQDHKDLTSQCLYSNELIMVHQIRFSTKSDHSSVTLFIPGDMKQFLMWVWMRGGRNIRTVKTVAFMRTPQLQHTSLSS